MTPFTRPSRRSCSSRSSPVSSRRCLAIALQIKGFGTFLLVVFAAALLDDEADVTLVIDPWRITALYLVLRGFAEWFAGSPTTSTTGFPAGSPST